MELSPHSVQPSGNRTLAYKLLGLSAGLALGAGAISLFMMWPMVDARLAVADTRTVEGAFETRSVYEYGLFGQQAVTLTHPGKLIDYDRTGTHEVVLAFLPETRDAAVVVLGAEARTLAASPTVKASISISADGGTVAYAEIANTEQGAAVATAEAFFDADRWLVKTVDVATGAITTHGVGYAPRLFTRDGIPYLLFTNGIGVRVVSLGSETKTDMIRVLTTTGSRPAEVADDGSHMALYDSTLKTYRIFKVTGMSGNLELEELPRAPGYHRVAFDGTHAIIAVPVFEAGTGVYHLAALDLTRGGTAVPTVRVLSNLFPNKIIP